MSFLLIALNMGAATVFLVAPESWKTLFEFKTSFPRKFHPVLAPERDSQLIGLLQWQGKGVHQSLDLRLLPVVNA
jgi:hypothetical protein